LHRSGALRRLRFAQSLGKETAHCREAMRCYVAARRMAERSVMQIAAALLAALVTVLPAEANGATPEQLFRQFGLFGTWASDCGAPVSPANPHVTISAPSPGVILEDDYLGTDYALNRYSVLAAMRLSRTRLQVEALFHPGAENEERQKLIFVIRGRTRRTVFTQVEGGPVRVKHGVALWDGSKTPLLRKCE
jgi:hypothetical protein